MADGKLVLPVELKPQLDKGATAKIKNELKKSIEADNNKADFSELTDTNLRIQARDLRQIIREDSAKLKALEKEYNETKFGDFESRSMIEANARKVQESRAQNESLLAQTQAELDKRALAKEEERLANKGAVATAKKGATASDFGRLASAVGGNGAGSIVTMLGKGLGLMGGAMAILKIVGDVVRQNPQYMQQIGAFMDMLSAIVAPAVDWLMEEFTELVNMLDELVKTITGISLIEEGAAYSAKKIADSAAFDEMNKLSSGNFWDRFLNKDKDDNSDSGSKDKPAGLKDDTDTIVTTINDISSKLKKTWDSAGKLIKGEGGWKDLFNVSKLLFDPIGTVISPLLRGATKAIAENTKQWADGIIQEQKEFIQSHNNENFESTWRDEHITEQDRQFIDTPLIPALRDQRGTDIFNQWNTKRNRHSSIKLAAGGIVSAVGRGVPAIVGEAGREAVLPLESNTEWMDLLADRIAGRAMNVQLNLDGKKLTTAVLSRSQRLAFATNGGR